MISASTLSCYSALSSHILITNSLITFLTLHSCYPVLQPINTFYSLIGAVYVFRVCVLFCPRFTSPLLNRYYPHVLSISCNYLAPPHFPESRIECFIPQCIYCSHVASVFARSLVLNAFCLFSFVFFGLVWSGLVLSWFLFPAICFLWFIIFCKSRFVFLYLLFIFCTPPPVVPSLVYSLLITVP